ncbi:hypothetical protein EJB05_40356, partial [Eragrostis curvula]
MAQAAEAAEVDVDRLSSLPDGVLGHILSFLPTYEAGRAAVLSSRWRHILASAHTFSFDQPESPFTDCESCYYSYVDEKQSRNYYFLNAVTAAFLCRRRCAGGRDPPLRVFRVSFDWYHRWDGAMVDRWLACATRNGAKELRHVELRLEGGREACDYEDPYRSTKLEDKMYKQLTDSSEDEDDLEGRGIPNFIEPDSDGNNVDEGYHWQEKLDYTVPKRIFTCVALRTLCLGGCLLNLPATISLPSLETLLLTGLIDSEEVMQRLISSCPCLVDLTLEACSKVHTISVLDTHLRRLALRCCHKLLSVTVDSSDLRVFEYKGAVPSPSLLTLHGDAQRISSCTIDFCGKELSMIGQFVWFKKLLRMFVGTKHLHLRSDCLGSGFEDPIFKRFPVFCRLRHLELTGRLQHYHAVDAITRILMQAPNLEVLSLVILPVSDHHPEDSPPLGYWQGDTTISCLRDHVREIKMVDYQGLEVQRKLLKFLLHNALVLDEICCVFPKGPLDRETEMMNEIKAPFGLRDFFLFLRFFCEQSTDSCEIPVQFL